MIASKWAVINFTIFSPDPSNSAHLAGLPGPPPQTAVIGGEPVHSWTRPDAAVQHVATVHHAFLQLSDQQRAERDLSEEAAAAAEFQ